MPRSWYEAQYADVRHEMLDPEQKAAKLIWLPALSLARGRVLDIGCGLGHIAHYVRCGYIGIDYSEEAVRLAKLTYGALGLFEVAQVPPLPEGYLYDTALMLEMLEHVYEDLEVLRAVPVGKRVVLSVPNYWTEGHCRWFSTPAQVLDRYKPLIDYSALRTSAAGNNRWWIVAGVRV
jgi:SAM-dependent methyltransferase